jgi:Lon protease-like protein
MRITVRYIRQGRRATMTDGVTRRRVMDFDRKRTGYKTGTVKMNGHRPN